MILELLSVCFFLQLISLASFQYLKKMVIFKKNSSLVVLNSIIKNQKRLHIKWEETFANLLFNKGIVWEHIKNSHNPITEKAIHTI